MLYSKTAKYAVLALAEVTRDDSDRPVPTKQIAGAASIPYPLLAKIVGKLRMAGLIRAARGKAGGILLARPADRMTILDVVLALDGEAVLKDCPLYLDPCDCERVCSLHRMWGPARDAMLQFLRSTTIQAVADARAQADGSKAKRRGG
jgi:Rrf2 family iron-sulfur cluster assembly transcriptional regulator